MGAETLAVKRCCHCRQTLPLDAFWRNRGRGDGREDTCATCRSVLREQARAATQAAEEAREAVPPPVWDERLLRYLVPLWRPEAAGADPETLDRLGDVLWKLICDPDHPQYRQAYETALELRRRKRVR